MSLRHPGRSVTVAGVETLATTAHRADQPAPDASLTAADVMTASEVAKLLHMPVSTVYVLARRGELPTRRLGRSWRFLRPQLEEFLWGP